jgi:hypothetical protein
MRTTYLASDYIYLLKAKIKECASIAPNDRVLPYTYDKTRTQWFIQRGGQMDQDTTLFKDQKDRLKASQAMALRENGQIIFRLYLREKDKAREIEIVKYNLAFLNLPDNPNKIQSLRYDYSTGQQRGPGWDDDLGDNPEHPQAHVHINFAGNDRTANNLRMPTGQVYPILPILILQAFDYWYCETFIKRDR